MDDNERQSGFSLTDFLSIIADLVFLPNNQKGSPFDIDFSKHFNVLYRIENKFRELYDKELKIERVFTNKQSKQLEIVIKNNLNASQKTFIFESCEELCIGYEEFKQEIKLYINKNSKGVIEERKW